MVNQQHLLQWFKISSELEGHIITIEDPIEYLYPHSKSLINQREIGVDSPTFADALKALKQILI